MRIEDLRSEQRDKRKRITATLVWEDSDRSAQDLYFETVEGFASALTCNPHAFIAGAIIPAMHYGEKRIFIEEEIDPELHAGLITAMHWLRHWYPEPPRELVHIEARVRARSPSRTAERAGLFLSGGVDSFAALRVNRLNFPASHPGFIKDSLLVFGLELDDQEAFDLVLGSLSEATSQLGITLIPVYTNVYLNYRSEDIGNKFSFWIDKLQAAALAAVAHAFSRRLTRMSIAASHDIPRVHPLGTHPLLDSNYSSSDLRIVHEGIELSRLDKIKLIADWDTASKYLRVCNQYMRYRPNRLNCGACEKCVRTMLALLALGMLDQTRAFLQNDVKAEQIREAVTIPGPMTESSYRELLGPLEDIGRMDLASAIRTKICKAHCREKKAIAWMGKFKRSWIASLLTG